MKRLFLTILAVLAISLGAWSVNPALAQKKGGKPPAVKKDTRASSAFPHISLEEIWQKDLLCGALSGFAFSWVSSLQGPHP